MIIAMVGLVSAFGIAITAAVAKLWSEDSRVYKEKYGAATMGGGDRVDGWHYAY